MKGLNVPDKTASEKFSKQRESMAHAKKKKKKTFKSRELQNFHLVAIFFFKFTYTLLMFTTSSLT